MQPLNYAKMLVHRGCTFALGGALTTYPLPSKLCPKIFFLDLHPSAAPPGYAYGDSWNCILIWISSRLYFHIRPKTAFAFPILVWMSFSLPPVFRTILSR